MDSGGVTSRATGSKASRFAFLRSFSTKGSQALLGQQNSLVSLDSYAFLRRRTKSVTLSAGLTKQDRRRSFFSNAQAHAAHALKKGWPMSPSPIIRWILAKSPGSRERPAVLIINGVFSGAFHIHRALHHWCWQLTLEELPDGITHRPSLVRAGRLFGHDVASKLPAKTENESSGRTDRG